MLKTISILCVLMLIIAYAYSSELADSQDKDLNEKMVISEIDKIDNNINKQLMYELLNKQRSKRSDIDSRLMELQAKIDLLKAYQNMPAGHGRFDFDKIGKRFMDPIKYMKLMDQEKK